MKKQKEKIQNGEHSAIQRTQFLQEVNYLCGGRGGEGRGPLLWSKRDIISNYNIRTIFGS